ncbi:MAG: beta-propeller fold lactonase family protein, partial [Planctomycetaceae bacterium]|nr:beta-propeller fold lactonase family protein [Planctomycetaceae bacterium]
PTEKTPRSFDISPDGRYLTAAGQDNGKIAVYRISPESGELTRVQTVEVGGNLAWVSLISFE